LRRRAIRRRLVVCALMLAAAVSPTVGLAQSVIYRWVDDRGVVHMTDDLGKVPEPYASMYQARIRAAEKKRAEAVGERKAPPPAPPPPRAKRPKRSKPTAAEIAERERDKWQKRIADWRGKLAAATEELARLDQEKARATVNPLLRVTAPVRAEIEEIEKKRALARKRVEEAKKMLLETLPEQARKAGVPYKWLL